MSLKILHRFFVPLRRCQCLERAQISSLAGLGVLLPRVQSVSTRFQFSDHKNLFITFDLMKRNRTRCARGRLQSSGELRVSLLELLLNLAELNGDDENQKNSGDLQKAAGRKPA